MSSQGIEDSEWGVAMVVHWRSDHLVLLAFAERKTWISYLVYVELARVPLDKSLEEVQKN